MEIYVRIVMTIIRFKVDKRNLDKARSIIDNLLQKTSDGGFDEKLMIRILDSIDEKR